MTDKKLLEAAANAAGVSLKWYGSKNELSDWNPLNNNGQALQLAVQLGIAVTPYPIYAQAKHSVIAKQYRNSDTMREANPTEVIELHGEDPEAATRLAIVRCAALVTPNALGQEPCAGVCARSPEMTG